MLRIAICDDEETSLKLNTALTEKVLKDENIDYEIQQYQNMREMTDALSKHRFEADVLLCDILTTDMNGIEAAERLRELGDTLDIIFISSTAEYALDGYRVQALRYIKKPVEIDVLREALLISNSKHSEIGGLTVTSKGQTYTINFQDVAYIESSRRDIDIHLADKVITTHMKISDIERLLPEKDFFRCHRSFIVNFNYMDAIERYQITMKNGDILCVSQQLYSDTKSRFSNHG